MKKIYDEAKDKNVAAVVFFGDTTDNKLYDKAGEGKTQITEAQLADAFVKGLVVETTESMLKPLAVTDEKVVCGNKSGANFIPIEFAALSASQVGI